MSCLIPSRAAREERSCRRSSWWSLGQSGVSQPNPTQHCRGGHLGGEGGAISLSLHFAPRLCPCRAMRPRWLSVTMGRLILCCVRRQSSVPGLEIPLAARMAKVISAVERGTLARRTTLRTLWTSSPRVKATSPGSGRSSGSRDLISASISASLARSRASQGCSRSSDLSTATRQRRRMTRRSTDMPQGTRHPLRERWGRADE